MPTVLIFHDIRTDASGYIAPWGNRDPGTSYDHILSLLWNYWSNVPSDQYGHPEYYSYRQLGYEDRGIDQQGIGGDQFAMAIDSWALYYQYTGDPDVLQNAQDLADFYLANSLTPPGYLYGNLPYPFNTGANQDQLVYDGDLYDGPGVLEPDKAGSFGEALISLYKVTGDPTYLSAAVNIADTLAATVNFNADQNNSPWPFRVYADTGAQPASVYSSYTTNYGPTLSLFQSLSAMGQGDVPAYERTFDFVLQWMRIPMGDNNWGPFFEDIEGYSNTEINADTWAYYLMRNASWDANWQQDVRAILDWTQSPQGFGDPTWGGVNWADYGVTPIDEQSAYPVPGNSHTARHAATELTYDALTGDTTNTDGAVRQLNWATYMVNFDGTNVFPDQGVWFTDGYVDYVRHYLRAMAADPALAPVGQSHLLSTSSYVTNIQYQSDSITYTTADVGAQDLLRVAFVPDAVSAGGVALPRLGSVADLQTQDGYTLNAPGDVPGVLRIHHSQSASVAITYTAMAPEAPSDLSATAASSSEIDLTWTGTSGAAVYFVVRRSTDPLFRQDVVTQETAATSLKDTDGLASAMTYYYRVRAVAGGDISPHSDTASAQTPDGNPPSGPAGPDFVAPDPSAGLTGPTSAGQGARPDAGGHRQQALFADGAAAGDPATVTRALSAPAPGPGAGGVRVSVGAPGQATLGPVTIGLGLSAPAPQTTAVSPTWTTGPGADQPAWARGLHHPSVNDNGVEGLSFAESPRQADLFLQSIAWLTSSHYRLNRHAPR